MRTQEQIAERMRTITASGEDFFGVERDELLVFLEFEKAKEFLKEGVTEAQWNEVRELLTDEVVLSKMRSYMEFAWDKANDCRGLSAARSIDHFRSMLWLLGDNDLGWLSDEYRLYGKPILKQICERFGWDWKQWHNGLAGNDESNQRPWPHDAAQREGLN